MQTHLFKFHPISFSQLKPSLGSCGLFAAILLLAYFLFPALTWENGFRAATWRMLTGQPIYIDGAYNPIWTYVLLTPLAILPTRISGALVSTLSLFSFGFVARKMGAKPLTVLLLLISPPILFVAYDGQLDWLVALGSLMPPRIGLFFVLIKPQVGIGIAVYWLFETYRRGGIKEVFQTFAPVSVGLLVSLPFIVAHLLERRSIIAGQFENWNVWPDALPIGLVLLVASIKNKMPRLSIFASPMLSPYVGFYSLSVTLLGTACSTVEAVFAVLGLYLYDFLDYQFIRTMFSQVVVSAGFLFSKL